MELTHAKGSCPSISAGTVNGINRAQAYRLIDIPESAGAIGAAGVLAVVSPAGDTAGLVDLGLSQRALRDVHGRLDELTTVVTERLTTAARRAGQLEVPAVRDIVAQAVDELRQAPLPAADNTAAKDSDDALERALADAERHPTDMTVVRRLVDEMVAAGGKLGQTALELTPAYLSDQEAADTVLARYAEPEHETAVEPVGRADAVRLTEQLRAAIAEARQAAVVLAGRVQEAHRARVWVPLGYNGWGEYAQAELGISRAQAYRLIDIAESAGALNRAIGAAGVLAVVSPAGDTAGLVDIGLSQRALRDVHGQPEDHLTQRSTRQHPWEGSGTAR
ncbi:hypothetical protein [Streptomyces sp. NBC_01727]|uniref:hypothetical protein n=1 Tax=Streptomyces sp. NBC_01727 TaxID=2975924 RepID=UPI002E0DDD7B|nr:hypothetical protein OIE76_43980 [Streptomyces sp. NBC_01727]